MTVAATARKHGTNAWLRLISNGARSGKTPASPLYLRLKRQAHRCDSLQPKLPHHRNPSRCRHRQREMKGADGHMGWAYRCAENALVTMRWTLISRNLRHVVEKPALLYRAPLLGCLEDDPDWSVKLPICDACTGRTTKLSFPSRGLQLFPTAGVSVVANLSTRTPSTPQWTVDGCALDSNRMIQRRHCATRTTSSTRRAVFQRPFSVQFPHGSYARTQRHPSCPS